MKIELNTKYYYVSDYEHNDWENCKLFLTREEAEVEAQQRFKRHKEEWEKPDHGDEEDSPDMKYYRVFVGVEYDDAGGI